MARKPASRKYQLTINNPKDHGFSHEVIKQQLNGFSSIIYWCMCDEIGTEEKTYHTHIYVVFKNAVMFETLQKRFYGAHIEMVQGNNQENYDYIRKQGKWVDDEKGETNLSDTFEEFGELPPDRQAGEKETVRIYEMIKDGASNYDILEAFPNAMNRLEKIERARQTYISEKHKNEFRLLEVTYIYGETGTGKTRSVMEEYGYENVYRVTNYQHPFDGYKGQDVILFDEFRSSLPISDMLIYLDGYPVDLPCRYANKEARYTKVFLCTNIPLERQYPQIQYEQPTTWNAFNRRITYNYQLLEDGTRYYPDSPFNENNDTTKGDVSNV
ncbi:MAG: replication protein [Oscillospiraceae bacterium]